MSTTDPTFSFRLDRAVLELLLNECTSIYLHTCCVCFNVAPTAWALSDPQFYHLEHAATPTAFQQCYWLNFLIHDHVQTLKRNRPTLALRLRLTLCKLLNEAIGYFHTCDPEASSVFRGVSAHIFRQIPLPFLPPALASLQQAEHAHDATEPLYPLPSKAYLQSALSTFIKVSELHYAYRRKQADVAPANSKWYKALLAFQTQAAIDMAARTQQSITECLDTAFHLEYFPSPLFDVESHEWAKYQRHCGTRKHKVHTGLIRLQN
ncbi:hypothetical protein H4R34_006200 [Dimargaris verticillata]|uniref:Uncharacterized protein n=1 Tax=Dimargaris verticillata TaxID=2761393 RepID=A0A9W8E9Q0_9FUNG|nr:hypothetical protein H4R34_006200 [Dimargaris verticillata]